MEAQHEHSNILIKGCIIGIITQTILYLQLWFGLK